MRKTVWIMIAAMVGLLYLGVITYHQLKPLPEGTAFVGESYMLAEEEISFLTDVTYGTEIEDEVYEHEIFDEIFSLIEEAEHFLVIDMFMVNEFSNEDRDYPELSSEFTRRIKNQMEEYPELKVVFITDPINTTYYSHDAQHIDPLKEAGAEVVYTDLTRLRDPNPIYSGFWRIGLQWFGQRGFTWLPNAFGETAPDVTVRSYLKLANIKANHRKTIMSENTGIITSANPHDASGFHSNVGVKVHGEIIKDMVKAERAVAAFSGGDLSRFPTEAELEEWIESADTENRPLQAQILTERRIEQAAIKIMNEAEAGDIIWCGMFYLSDRYIIEAMQEAEARGVEIRLILDPNQNAFGQEKIGLPNIPVARELLLRTDGNLTVRWYDTQEEQYHSKILYADRGDVRNVITGAANYTTRNLGNYNLENNISITAPADTAFMQEVDDYFMRMWENEDAHFTVEYEVYSDAITPFKYVLYTLQKSLRFTTY
ncbi:phospholipase D family protein [Alkalicoccus daliensis]|uniref:phospholipase D n=1 Tax=Alkalicoccus daliensis TaxID=745820 RepID=A0A1H0FY53_9BACI|nr:phospholipase D family protein [Alkalicoccus daliensis]SDN99587.1 PLD-like domain-containing protein [Alkalicoccus daliensis]